MLQQVLQYGEGKRRGFSRTCLRATHEVYPLQSQGDYLGLDGSWFNEAHGLYGSHEIGMKAQFCKWHLLSQMDCM